MARNTGNGVTLTFGGSAFVGFITNIKGPTLKRAVVDTTDLSDTVNMSSIQGDLTEWDEIEVEFNWNDETGGPTITAAAASIVLTFPIGGLATAADLTGTGFITEVSYPTFANDELQKGTAKLKFDGETGPTHTAGAAS